MVRFLRAVVGKIPAGKKRVIILAHDFTLSFIFSFFWHLYFYGSSSEVVWLLGFSFLSSALLVLSEIIVGADRLVVRRMGVRSAKRMGAAFVFYIFLLLAVELPILYKQAMTPWGGIVTVVGLAAAIFIAVILTRCLARWLLLSKNISGRREASRRFLIYGAGAAGARLAANISDGGLGQVVGFLDDNERLKGRYIDEWAIFGPERLASIIERYQVTDVVVAMPSADRKVVARKLDALLEHPVRVRLLPALEDLAGREVTYQDVREPSIVDLLGREPAQPDPELLRRDIMGSDVLITGAGGSIGSELCKQILSQRPRRLILLDVSEYALYNVVQDVTGGRLETDNGVEIVPLLGSVLDKDRIETIFRVWSPRVVYHAAAYKHVPIVEQNVIEGVRTNVFGTMICAQAAAHYGARKFVLISTDKAVRPTNIMGASKRVAELLLQAYAEAKKGGGCCYTMVRFGNVLGSSGSVVPLFQRQIQERKPITITHPDVTRYFMTVSEAAQLVIQAGAMAKGGEVFLLDMGEPVRVFDLARRLVELSGLTIKTSDNPEGDIAIEFIGLRPGEKLKEELLIDGNPLPTRHPKIFKAKETRIAWSVLKVLLMELEKAVKAQDVPAVINLLRQTVGDYRPEEDIVDLSWRASYADRMEALDVIRRAGELGTVISGQGSSVAANIMVGEGDGGSAFLRKHHNY